MNNTKLAIEYTLRYHKAMEQLSHIEDKFGQLAELFSKYNPDQVFLDLQVVSVLEDLIQELDEQVWAAYVHHTYCNNFPMDNKDPRKYTLEEWLNEIVRPVQE